jgi:hypothetical protein
LGISGTKEQDPRKLSHHESNDIHFSSNFILVNQIKKKEVSGTCVMCGEKEKHVQGFGGEAERKEIV